jgi:hypothetical protein
MFPAGRPTVERVGLRVDTQAMSDVAVLMFEVYSQGSEYGKLSEQYRTNAAPKCIIVAGLAVYAEDVDEPHEEVVNHFFPTLLI